MSRTCFQRGSSSLTGRNMNGGGSRRGSLGSTHTTPTAPLYFRTQSAHTVHPSLLRSYHATESNDKQHDHQYAVISLYDELEHTLLTAHPLSQDLLHLAENRPQKGQHLDGGQLLASTTTVIDTVHFSAKINCVAGILNLFISKL